LAERPLEPRLHARVSINPSRKFCSTAADGRPDGISSRRDGNTGARTYERSCKPLLKPRAIRQRCEAADLRNGTSTRTTRAARGGAPSSWDASGLDGPGRCGAWPTQMLIEWSWSWISRLRQRQAAARKYNVENQGRFLSGVIVNGGRLLYLAGQVGTTRRLDRRRRAWGVRREESKRTSATCCGRRCDPRGRERDDVGAEHRLLAAERSAVSPRRVQDRFPARLVEIPGLRGRSSWSDRK